jgi:hypothetical protein
VIPVAPRRWLPGRGLLRGAASALAAAVAMVLLLRLRNRR